MAETPSAAPSSPITIAEDSPEVGFMTDEIRQAVARKGRVSWVGQSGQTAR